MRKLSTICRIQTTAALLLAVLAQAAMAQGQAWPTRPIELITPFPAGGPTDDVSRFLAQRLGAELGQPVVVINVAGAGGSIGMQRLARAPKDGYTIGLAHTGTHTLTPLIYAHAGYDPVKDFSPVAQLTEYSNVLVVNAQAPYKNLQDLINAARRNPGTINYGSAGNGTSNHLSTEMLATMTGAKFTHVPYKGSAPALIDVLAGNVPFMFDVLPNSMTHIRAGRLRALATTGKTRDRMAPDVPTVAETVPGFAVVGWVGIVAPAGTPPRVVDRLSKSLEKVMAQPDSVAFFDARGNNIAYAGPTPFGARITDDLKRWAPVVKASGAKVD